MWYVGLHVGKILSGGYCTDSGFTDIGAEWRSMNRGCGAVENVGCCLKGGM